MLNPKATQREYKRIYICADCAYYNMKKHCCTLGAHEEKDARRNFYDDCPLPSYYEVKGG